MNGRETGQGRAHRIGPMHDALSPHKQTDEDPLTSEELVAFFEREYGTGPTAQAIFDPSRGPEAAMAALKDLLLWFKEGFPYYKSTCLHCGNTRFLPCGCVACRVAADAIHTHTLIHPSTHPNHLTHQGTRTSPATAWWASWPPRAGNGPSTPRSPRCTAAGSAARSSGFPAPWRFPGMGGRVGLGVVYIGDDGGSLSDWFACCSQPLTSDPTSSYHYCLSLLLLITNTNTPTDQPSG